MTALRIIVALLAGVTASSGQGFKVTTELVTIPVTVTDRSGATMVRGLQATDFRVIEAGVEQPVSA